MVFFNLNVPSKKGDFKMGIQSLLRFVVKANVKQQAQKRARRFALLRKVVRNRRAMQRQAKNRAMVHITLYLAMVAILVVPVQAQHHVVTHTGATLHVYTIPILADTVVVITNPSDQEIHVEHDFYTDQAARIDWHGGSGWLQPRATKALWRCYVQGDTAWGSLVVSSTKPLAIATYMDMEIARGYGCP